VQKSFKDNFAEYVAKYGSVAVVVYFSIFAVVLTGMWVAIHLGWQPQSVTGNVGALGAAWVATKVTQPLRIAATLALTPLAARLYARFGGAAAEEPVVPAMPPVDLR
jgi:hypothetical protein